MADRPLLGILQTQNEIRDGPRQCARLPDSKREPNQLEPLDRLPGCSAPTLSKNTACPVKPVCHSEMAIGSVSEIAQPDQSLRSMPRKIPLRPYNRSSDSGRDARSRRRRRSDSVPIGISEHRTVQIGDPDHGVLPFDRESVLDVRARDSNTKR
ncbi:MAG: hypothetical protein MZU97_01335 [Bacillus subtilis]|nr:hypothetical protein [Bacillus subtilis]